MKKSRKLLSLLLALVMIFSTSVTAFASNQTLPNTPDTVSEESGSIIITDTGVYINGTFYTQEQFIQLLDIAVEVETTESRSSRTTAGLIAGTWWIPGVGEVIITAAGVIVVAGTVVAAGTWIYKTITNWFATRAFNKSAEDAINNCDSNKRIHIMNKKHNWNKFNKDPKWNNVAPILIKTLKEGTEKWERGNIYIRTLIYKGETVVVRFMKNSEGLVKNISTAWCK